MLWWLGISVLSEEKQEGDKQSVATVPGQNQRPSNSLKVFQDTNMTPSTNTKTNKVISEVHFVWSSWVSLSLAIYEKS